MRFQTKKRHAIDLIFPISLFFVFAASSLAVLLLAANIYSSTTLRTTENYRERTTLSYITEKIRQNDVNGGISIGTFDGVESLILTQEYQGTNYVTYIYEYDGMLKELYIKEDVNASCTDGKDITPISDFQAEEISNHLFRFTSTNEDGKRTSIVVGSKS